MRSLFLIAFVFVAACSSDDDAQSVDGGTDAPVSRIDGGDGAACGGLAGARCDEDAFCDYAGHTCGKPEAAGQCSKRPETCLDLIEPVCGCDGTVYNNECLAQKAGADPSDTATCQTPPDHTRCGYRFCTASQQCKMSGSGDQTTYSCDAR